MNSMYGDSLFSRHTGVKLGVGVIIKGESTDILLERRSDNGMWGLPGGGVEPGETVMQTAVREVKEETGLDISVTGLLGIYSDPADGRIVTYPDNGDVAHLVDIVLTATVDSGGLSISDESLDLRFFNTADLPDNIAPPAIRPLKDFQKGKKREIN